MVLCCICGAWHSAGACPNWRVASHHFGLRWKSPPPCRRVHAALTPRGLGPLSAERTRAVEPPELLQTHSGIATMCSMAHGMCSFCPSALHVKVQCLRSEARRSRTTLGRCVVESAGGCCGRCLPTRECAPALALCLRHLLFLHKIRELCRTVGLQPRTSMPKHAETKPCMLLLLKAGRVAF